MCPPAEVVHDRAFADTPPACINTDIVAVFEDPTLGGAAKTAAEAAGARDVCLDQVRAWIANERAARKTEKVS
ncbi:MAG: hypothetical protein AAFY10_01090 [Pseudomonadota bacterium]